MSGSIELSLDEGALIAPPVIDLAHFDETQRGYVITFVPEDSVSRNEKEMVLISRDDAEWMHVRHAWAQLNKLLPAPVDQIAHGGGSDFTLKMTNGTHYTLSGGSPANDVTQRLYDLLQRLGMIAQIQFLIQMRAHSKSA